MPPHKTCEASPPLPHMFRHTDELSKFVTPHFVDHLGDHVPIPTNEWWGNLLAWKDRCGSDSVFANPFTHQVSRTTLTTSYLHRYIVKGPLNDNDAINHYYYPPTIKNLIFGATEFDAKTCFKINGWDEMGVHLEWTLEDSMPGSSKSLQTYLALGGAFITLRYSNLQFKLSTDHAMDYINGVPAIPGHTYSGSSFKLTLNNHQDWLLYFFGENSIDLLHHGDYLTTTQCFNGIVQVAYLPRDDPQAKDLYDSTAGTYVNSGRFCFDTRGSSSCFDIEWNTESCSANKCREKFLHFGLEHHMKLQRCSSMEYVPSLLLHSPTRGRMHAFITHRSSKWQFQIPIEVDQLVEHCASFFSPREISMHDISRWNICKILQSELQVEDWPNAKNPEASYYFRGKALQKIASLCLLAIKLATITQDENMIKCSETSREKLKSLLISFANNRSSFPLVYDTVYKGIISSEALVRGDIHVDFSSATYNDHHYHYGYYVNAAAVLFHLDPCWANSTEAEPLKVVISCLIRDAANIESLDPYFPRFRHFNWFLGHSYSHGVSPMADGKDEESVTEDINLSNGLALYGFVTGDKKLETAGKLMIKLSAIAIPTYFFISSDNTTHPVEFRNNKISGVFFDNKCDYATWFSPNKECIHGIQMLPIIPVLEAIRSKGFVQEEWDCILSKLDCVKNWRQHGSGWTSLLFANYSTLDKEQSCQVLSECPLDDGLSRAWALYYACTRP